MVSRELREHIKKILSERGLVQAKVAERAGFSKQQFSAMMAGRKIIRAEYIPDIADALGVSIGEIFSPKG